jgi:UDP-N-acetylglucosamine transferase subunit ALG13
MIFLSVGTQLGFDRLVEAVDMWAQSLPSIDVYAQIGQGDYVPRNMEYCRYLSASEYTKIFDSAKVVVSHAGMGTIISCLTQSKPIVIMPRIAELGEHRNDHQAATCKRFSAFPGCNVVYNVEELSRVLDNIATLRPGHLRPHASDELIAAIDTYMNN